MKPKNMSRTSRAYRRDKQKQRRKTRNKPSPFMNKVYSRMSSNKFLSRAIGKFK